MIGKIKLLTPIFMLSLLGFSSEFQAAPSFDCAKAGTRVEHMICASQTLAAMDSELAAVYRSALAGQPGSPANQRIRRAQIAWLRLRNRCTTEACVKRIYQSRLDDLLSEVGGSGGDGQGPQSAAEAMISLCADRAAQIFNLPAPSFDVKYQGRRTDGTHAVNGSAFVRGKAETFQCSFNTDGATIARFIVN